MQEHKLHETETFLVNAREAARLCGISRASWYRLHSSGRCPLPVRLGNRTLWRRQELEAWVKAGCPARQKWEDLKKTLESA
jgi:predicted DNA-binding transcriptional regulator AlpA